MQLEKLNNLNLTGRIHTIEVVSRFIDVEQFKKLKWKFAVAKEATNRDLHTPYPNCYMSSIDGFLCSPDLKILSIEAIQDFRYSDHCPVCLKIRLK